MANSLWIKKKSCHAHTYFMKPMPVFLSGLCISVWCTKTCANQNMHTHAIIDFHIFIYGWLTLNWRNATSDTYNFYDTYDCISTWLCAFLSNVCAHVPPQHAHTCNNLFICSIHVHFTQNWKTPHHNTQLPWGLCQYFCPSLCNSI